MCRVQTGDRSFEWEIVSARICSAFALIAGMFTKSVCATPMAAVKRDNALCDGFRRDASLKWML